MIEPDMEQEDRKRWLWWAIPAAVVIALGGALYYGRQHQKQPAPAAAEVKPEPVAAAPEAPSHNPIEPQAGADATALPELGQSDADIQKSLSGVLGSSLQEFLVPKDIVKHIVATVDNLPRKKTAVQLWPVKPVGGDVAVTGTEELTLSDANFARYEPMMKVLRNTDAGALAAVYKHFYPLFQQAYVELGYPDGYFNDRAIAVIDHLLQTPEVAGPIKLTQPSVRYEFVDPALQERSAGQKLLIRMGSDNATAVKLKLRELRREIAKRPD